ncbi:hypothetical protein CONCODRAFT_131174 [Conidiobolus coronatus NRRL 28638]|uniref:Uncharacterized protein n=1 Tax=Conidiobolus coronatus (strain ATCC 28846 / CBS 209.66 / NRRL 28638) TaxID=796925 RepID=A0A137PC13_CONC2|nr:hypothetical protein CONCODRAFT_131174 [Conidiobolus coronatus NRRL 28638]|eukprot:KXN72540.1 hypothetical protein CONCODRAFT_131174 [Conidiobolus coronatus NRRL 28638]
MSNINLTLYYFISNSLILFSNETLYHYFSTQLPPCPPTLDESYVSMNKPASVNQGEISLVNDKSVDIELVAPQSGSSNNISSNLSVPSLQSGCFNSSAPSTPTATITSASTSTVEASAEPFTYQLNPVIEYLYNRWKLKWAA